VAGAGCEFVGKEGADERNSGDEGETSRNDQEGCELVEILLGIVCAIRSHYHSRVVVFLEVNVASGSN
jgi:hypothetical protein